MSMISTQPRLSRNEWRAKEDARIAKLMALPADVSPAAPPPRVIEVQPGFVFRKEQIRSAEVQRYLHLEDSYLDEFPMQAAALYMAHNRRVPYELLY
jgi:hypothetical protein